MKIISLFSGIGAFEKALDNLDIPYELVGFSEIDKYAIKSYTAIHNVPESMNLGDITKINEKTLPKDIDLLTYGFPCQDISLAGNQKGLFAEGGVKTRSGLVFESLRIIEEVKPKVCIAENVKNLVSKKFSEQFKIVLMYLEAAGYNNYWKVLNSKDYGVPQNRERVFIVSIRKDIDNGAFEFPKGFPLDIRLKDVLEDEVDEKFYLSEVATRNLAFNTALFNSDEITDYKDPVKIGIDKSNNSPNIIDIANCITAREDRGISNRKAEGTAVVEFNKTDIVMQIGNLMPSATRDNPNQGRLYDKNGIAPTLGAMQGGNRQPFVIEDFYKNREARVYEETAPTLRGERNGLKVADSLRIRKLTPKECFRLMGFDDESFHKAEAVNSNTQLFKQAGNSIVIPVLEHLLDALRRSGIL